MNGRVDIHVFLDIGAISDHNAHGDAQGEEDLAHSIKQNLQESLDGQPFEVGRQIDGQSLESGARHACIVRVGECQREDGDRHDHDQHDGHQYFGALLDTFFNAVKDDPGCQEHENHGIQSRLARRSDEICEETVRSGQPALPGQVDHDVARDPAANDRVVGHDQHRDQKSQNPQKTPLRAHLGISPDGILAGPAADCDVAGQKRKTESESQDQINQNEKAAAVLGRQIGEAPEIADADRAAGRRHDEADLAGEAVLLVRVAARGAACCRLGVVFCHSYSLLHLVYCTVCNSLF